MPRPLKAAKSRAGNTAEQITTSVRMDAGLRAKLERAADDGDRHLSQEIERRLRRSFDPQLLGEDAIDAAMAKGGINTFEGRWLVTQALYRACGGAPANVGAWFAITLATLRMLKETEPGTKLRVSKRTIDRAKAAIREIEKECEIFTGIPVDNEDGSFTKEED